MSNLSHLEPNLVWDFFGNITKYPRPSKQEEKIVAYIEELASSMKLELKKDALGNIVIRKPATPGMENRKSFAIQAHLDMVCEKNRDVEFDFDNDPIQAYVDGDWVKAKGTTLGADNGIGLAMGLAVLASTDIKHSDYELLCTLDEETGLTGAIRLGTDLLRSEILINLDSEEDGHFTIGCAGGLNTSATYLYVADSVPSNHIAYEIGIKGLRGGHSGIEIHDDRACSNLELAFILWELKSKISYRLSSFNGGNKHNAIPREAFAVITIDSADKDTLEAFVKEQASNYKMDLRVKEPDVEVLAWQVELPSRVLSTEAQEKLIASFVAMPHGVLRMSPDIAGLVQTSTNFAVVTTRENDIHVLTSQRSSVDRDKKRVAARVQASLELGGATVQFGDGYPAWEPNVSSPILKTAQQIYKDMFGKDAVIEAIHAGLECGLIGEKYPHMDMLSFGPTLKEVHTPNEKVQISTVQNCWKLLIGIIENMPEKN